MKNERGFSLLELLVVIGIIGILVAIGTISYSTAQTRSRDARRRSDVENIGKALEQYYAANSAVYPMDDDCTGYETYLASGAPTDPKYGFEYADSVANTRSGDSSGFCEATGTTFCLCIQLETDDTGNAYGRSGSTCTWSGTGDKNYYCVQNLQ